MLPNWLNRKEYPFTSRYFVVNGHRLHYVDEGRGDVLLFVHGTPSWSFDFRKVIGRLSATHRCIAPDHLGFGLSDKPADYDYSVQNHSRTLEKFIDSLGLNNITLVVHDFGGPIGINAALNRPELFSRVVILNSWLWSAEGEPAFEKLKRVLNSPLLPLLYRYLNFSPRVLLPASFGKNKPAPAIRKHYTRPFRNPSERFGPLAFARSLVNDQSWFESLWERRKVLANKPVLLLWGLKDPVLSPAYLEKFRSGFPGAQVITFPTAGHFPQEEVSIEVIKAILSE